MTKGRSKGAVSGDLLAQELFPSGLGFAARRGIGEECLVALLQVKCAVRPDLVDGNEALGVAVVAQRDSLAQAVEVLAFQRGADCCGRARIGLPRRLGPQVHRCVRRGRGVERLARAVLGLATTECGVAFGDVANGDRAQDTLRLDAGDELAKLLGTRVHLPRLVGIRPNVLERECAGAAIKLQLGSTRNSGERFEGDTM